MIQKVIKTGNSLAVTIPSFFAKSLAVKAGDSVRSKVEVDKGRVVYFFSGAQQLPLLDNILKRREK